MTATPTALIIGGASPTPTSPPRSSDGGRHPDVEPTTCAGATVRPPPLSPDPSGPPTADHCGRESERQIGEVPHRAAHAGRRPRAASSEQVLDVGVDGVGVRVDDLTQWAPPGAASQQWALWREERSTLAVHSQKNRSSQFA